MFVLVVRSLIHSLSRCFSVSLALVSLNHLRASFSAHIPDIDYFNDSIYMYSNDAITPYTIYMLHLYTYQTHPFPFFLPFSSMPSFFLHSFSYFHFEYLPFSPLCSFSFVSFLFFFLLQTEILWLSAGDGKQNEKNHKFIADEKPAAMQHANGSITTDEDIKSNSRHSQLPMKSKHILLIFILVSVIKYVYR